MPTALIVEDEPEANRLLSRIVQLKGYTTRSAHSGAEAVAAVQSDSFDIVFLDLMLPDMNGYEVCRVIKQHPVARATPVVVVTARLVDENRAKSAEVGADGFIPKPYTPVQIFEALAHADAARSTAADTPEGS